jgi:N-acetyl sugar amidotransferase
MAQLGDIMTICKRCVMDTSDPDIIFDEQGYCNHCTTTLANLNKGLFVMSPAQRFIELSKLLALIKTEGKHKKYDCIIGVSGGTDSTYVAYMLKRKYGLRPLAVHLDNGWDSELAVDNIKKFLDKLDIPLYTHVLEWDEFKDLQLSFLRASVPDLDIPADHAIVSSLYMMAAKYSIKYILNGQNYKTESILPAKWSYGHLDWRYIKGIHKQFGMKDLSNYPHLSVLNLIYYIYIKGIQSIRILDYVDFNKKEAADILEKELGWRSYGGKHQESIYTKFMMGYIYPRKFKFDHRRAQFSDLICSGQLTRDEALAELEKPIYTEQEAEDDIKYICDKFQISREIFNQLMSLRNKTFFDYPSSENQKIYIILKKLYHKFKRNEIR